jgi:hypothetical protein
MDDKQRTLKVHEATIETYMSIFGVSREDAIAALQARGLIPANDENSFDIADWSYGLVEAELDDMHMQDAKLSAEQRKKLKKSTFCGPDRSFPVPDCAHVTAARRLIGRAKGLSASQKQSILSCVSRKAKALGCKSSKKEKK